MSYSEQEAHGALGHSGTNGHHCLAWDDMWICDDCNEVEWCACEFEGASERERAALRARKLEERTERYKRELADGREDDNPFG